jgi:putative flippase GtrA
MSTFFRWLKFNAIGMAGVGVQLLFLHLLVRASVGYLAATALAVEAAVLHNFAWHQKYTWADRPSEDLYSVVVRLVRFHLSNGAVSIAGNVLLMRWLVGGLHVPILPANFGAILVCSLINFLLGDRFVFRDDAGWGRRSDLRLIS